MSTDIEKRKDVLLKAAHDLLKKCNEGFHVQDVITATAVWDGVECDGGCLLSELEDMILMGDIKVEDNE